jgi:hypothetical protein
MVAARMGLRRSCGGAVRRFAVGAVLNVWRKLSAKHLCHFERREKSDFCNAAKKWIRHNSSKTSLSFRTKREICFFPQSETADFSPDEAGFEMTGKKCREEVVRLTLLAYGNRVLSQSNAIDWRVYPLRKSTNSSTGAAFGPLLAWKPRQCWSFAYGNFY